MQALETQYNGYKYRSRLEARFAVFFDVLGIAYFYEHEGYKLSNGVPYLPDFWLPALQCFVEIKPQEATGDEEERCRVLAQDSAKRVILTAGLPASSDYTCVMYGGEFTGPLYGQFAWCRRGNHLCFESPQYGEDDFHTWDCFGKDTPACGERYPVTSLQLEDAIRRCRAHRFGIFDNPVERAEQAPYQHSTRPRG